MGGGRPPAVGAKGHALCPVPTGPPTNCTAFIYLKYNDFHISNAKDPFNLDADPGSALEKNGSGSGSRS